MSRKRYQISSIELVQWAEPLVFGEGEAKGFSEELISSYEAAAGIRLPAAFRSYLLVCGQANLNSTLHEMFIPNRNAEPFEHRLTFSYDYIKGDLKWFQENGQKDYEELARLRALPQQKWSEVAGNYLLLWCENQGCWYAGIKAEDLNQPDPVVYFNNEDDMYHWAPFADSVNSFLLSTVLENLEEELPADEIEDPAEIQKVLARGGVDFRRLQEPYPFSGGRFAHTCLDTDTSTLYVYGEQAEGRSEYLKIFQDE